MALASMSEIFERMARNGQEFWEVVLADDMDERQVSREASMAKMLTTWPVSYTHLTLPTT